MVDNQLFPHLAQKDPATDNYILVFCHEKISKGNIFCNLNVQKLHVSLEISSKRLLLFIFSENPQSKREYDDVKALQSKSCVKGWSNQMTDYC